MSDPTATQTRTPSPEHWRDKVSAEAWNILFKEDTERPFTSPLNKEKRAGTFVCAACHQPLFTQAQKFDSGTGWPSFFDVLPGTIATRIDRKLLFSVRTEYHCARCGGHHGHVFEDGPHPTGLRYCNNGLALKFIPEGDDLPVQRG